MTRFLILCFLALPLSAQTIQWSAGARAGQFTEDRKPFAATLELEARSGNWSLASAGEFIQLSDNTHAIHLDVRRYFGNLWIGGGRTWVRSDAPSSSNTWNADVGLSFLSGHAWQPYVAARFYEFDMPIFRDRIKAGGALVSLGVLRRFH